MNKNWSYGIYGIVAVIVVVAAFLFISKSSSFVLVNQNSNSTSTPTSTSTIPIEKVFQYIQIENGCDWTGVGQCVNMRSGPGTQYSVISRLRNGVVLKVDGSVVSEGRTWYKIIFGTELLYPERVKGDLYVANIDSVKLFTDVGDKEVSHVNASSTKRILVDVSKEMLYAYDGDILFMKQAISTGLEFTPTPKGTFFILKKTPSRYMQGPIVGVSDQYYDLPGVPWDLYFTYGGAVIHGAYWHNKFGQPWSHGCVNLPPDEAEKLYKWADVGMPVIIQN